MKPARIVFPGFWFGESDLKQAEELARRVFAFMGLRPGKRTTLRVVCVMCLHMIICFFALILTKI